MRREMSDMQTELLALREPQRRARQPGPEARIPGHQDASGDADSLLITGGMSPDKNLRTRGICQTLGILKKRRLIKYCPQGENPPKKLEIEL
ncbi:hypothetical protein Tco_0364807 [Tanacetum coccineum]